MIDIISKKEYEVAELVTRGHTEKEISTNLFIAVTTVKTHKKRIMQKTGARSSVDIARKFILSLEHPKKFFLTMLFLLMQIGIIGENPDIDLRRTSRVRTRISTSRTIKK
jgi:DNA-binding CsgD family transcriptional regulator